MSETHRHQPVLLEEAIAGLAIKPAGIYVDGTFGRGGHSRAILEQLGRQGWLIAIDKDPEAIAYGKKIFVKEKRFSIHQASFKDIGEILQGLAIDKVDGILLDLGLSSPQVDSAERGFSFKQCGPLDMRMDTTQGIDAATWLATTDEDEIVHVLKAYGEERFAKRIARTIVERREVEPIQTTQQLADLICQAVPTRERKKHPATRSFQAIRIVVNRELEDLKQSLENCYDVLRVKGRFVVISFHSLEDRIVKEFVRKFRQQDSLPAEIPIQVAQTPPSLQQIGKIIKPTTQEIAVNPRARSAVLRVMERLL